MAEGLAEPWLLPFGVDRRRVNTDGDPNSTPNMQSSPSRRSSLPNGRSSELTVDEPLVSLVGRLAYLRMSDMSSLCPLATWLPICMERPWDSMSKDIVCGITVASVLVPQGMAYGMLADLPAVYGLYTALMPSLVYMSFGTCRHLSVGPFALIAMLSAQAISVLVPEPREDPIRAAEISALLCMMVGVILITFGVLRLGFVVTFFSDPVLSGFCTASSLVIPASQLKYAIQVPLPKGSFVDVVSRITEVVVQGKGNVTSMVVFVVSVLVIIVLQGMNKNPPARLREVLSKFPFPAELIVVVGSTVASYLLSLQDCPGPCLQTLGAVPAGLPAMRLPMFASSDIVALARPSALVASMTYIMSMSVSKTFGRKYGYEVDNNQELIALGSANLLGSISSCFPASASLSRTAIAASAGARTPMHNFWTILTVLFVLCFCGAFLQPLPLAALAAIVVMAFKALLVNGVSECWWSFKVSLRDFVVWQIAFWATLTQDVSSAIGIAVAADMLYLFYKTTRPTHSVLGRLPGSGRIYQSLTHFPEADEIEGVVIVRFDGPLHFANREVFVTNVWDVLRCRERRTMDATDKPAKQISMRVVKSWLTRKCTEYLPDDSSKAMRAVVLDASPITHIDMSAGRAIEKLRKELSDRGTKLVIAHMSYECTKKLGDMGLLDAFEDAKGNAADIVIFRELHDAVLYAEGLIIAPCPGLPRASSLPVSLFNILVGKAPSPSRSSLMETFADAGFAVGGRDLDRAESHHNLSPTPRS